MAYFGNSYPNQYQFGNYNLFQQPVPQTSFNQQPTNIVPMKLVGSMDEVKDYIVSPNTTVFLKLGNSIFEKSVDALGNLSFHTFEMKPQPEESKPEFITKADLDAYGNSLIERLKKELGGVPNG